MIRQRFIVPEDQRPPRSPSRRLQPYSGSPGTAPMRQCGGMKSLRFGLAGASSYPEPGSCAGSPSLQRVPVMEPLLEPDPAAFHGLAGRIVREVQEHTEADPMALLIDLLVSFGAATGLGPFMRTDGSLQRARLYAVVVGTSSRSRKGTSRAVVRRILEAADEGFVENCEVTGLSTGEGLIEAFRKREDNRLLAFEPEFSRLLRVAHREGNTLTDVMRDLWDRNTASVLTRGNPLKVDDAHLCFIGHITAEELRDRLTSLEAANGFANRFLILEVERRHRLPLGNSLEDSKVEELGRQFRSAADSAKTQTEITWAEETKPLWTRFYESLPDDLVGIAGGLTARTEAQVVRIAMIFCLLDGKDRIDPAQLTAAIAVWSYCERSVFRIFGNREGRWVVDRLLDLLDKAGPQGVSKTHVYRALGNSVRQQQLDPILDELLAKGLIGVDRANPGPQGGRPSEIISRRPLSTPEAKKPKEPSPAAIDEPEPRPMGFLRRFGARVKRGLARTTAGA